MGNQVPKSSPYASFILEMFFGSSLSTRIICLRSLTIVKRACNARDLIGPQAALRFQGAALDFRTRSSPDTFFAGAEWSSPFCKTKS
jgi:hypothetical protein